MHRSLAAALFSFALVSMLSQFGRRQYLAEARVFFPGVQPRLYSQLNRSLEAEPDLPGNLDLGENNEVAQMAAVILRSQPARLFAQTTGGQRRGTSLEVSLEDGGSIHLLSQAPTAELAHDQLSGVLDYYTDFVKRNPLTRVAKARADLDIRMAQNTKSLSALEDQLVTSRNREMRGLGLASLKTNSKVMSEVWLRRLDGQQKNRQLLQKLEKLRGGAVGPEVPGSEWLKSWAGERLNHLPVAGALKAAPVSRQDLLKQAKLERDYYDALLLHRSLILQRSFLLTWEALENSQFEMVEPITINPYRPPALTSLTWGVFAGVVAGWLTTLSGRRSKGG